MSKIKTHKATAKRIMVTKGKKLQKRKAGQDHFNARESGNTKRNKRRDISVSKSFERTMKSVMPYN